MKTPIQRFLAVVPRRLAGWAGLAFGIAAGAQAQPFASSIPCTIVPINTTLPGLVNVAARGLSEPDADGWCYLAGECSTYPVIQPGIFPGGTAWTVALPGTVNTGGLAPLWQLNGAGAAAPYDFSAAKFNPALLLNPLPLANSAYATGTGAALTGAATPSVRVGYTVIHPPAGLRYHATSWVVNGAGNGYVVNDLDAGSLFDSSRVYGVVERDDGSLLVVGAGTTVGTHGFNPQTPLFWTLNADGTVSAGPTSLPPQIAKRDAVAFAGSTRFDATTIVGTGPFYANRISFDMGGNLAGHRGRSFYCVELE